MKSYFLLAAFSCFSQLSFSQTNIIASEGLDANQAAKDYFLCRCINAGFEYKLLKKEFSASLYREYMLLTYEELVMFDHLAEKIGIEAPSYKDSTNIHESVTGRTGVFITCLEYYKSPELDSLIRTFEFSKYARKSED